MGLGQGLDKLEKPLSASVPMIWAWSLGTRGLGQGGRGLGLGLDNTSGVCFLTVDCFDISQWLESCNYLDKS